jgi:hypothetical protein
VSLVPLSAAGGWGEKIILYEKREGQKMAHKLLVFSVSAIGNYLPSRA